MSSSAPPLPATVRVRIANRALARRVERAIASAVATAEAALTSQAAQAGQAEVPARVVRFRTRKRLAALTARGMDGAIAVIQVTPGNARHLPELALGARAAGAAGVQLVWNGEDPPRERVERHVFAVLERARATKSAAPILLAPDADPVPAMYLLIAHRRRKEQPSS